MVPMAVLSAVGVVNAYFDSSCFSREGCCAWANGPPCGEYRNQSIETAAAISHFTNLATNL